MEDAKSVFDKPDDIEVDGHTLFIDFATRRSSIGLGGGWDKEVDLNEGNKNCVILIVSHKCYSSNLNLYH